MKSTEVNIQDGATKSHWFKATFYRKDGGKHTLATKKLTGISIVSITVIATYLMLQGSPSQTGGSGIATPETGATNSGIDIPDVSTTNSALSKSEVVATGKGRKGTKKVYTAPQLVSRPRLPVPPGSMVKARLITGASNGSVRAEIVEGLVINGETVIDPGMVISGMGASTEDRLMIQFDQMSFKDGAFQSIRAQALDSEDKIPGIKGSTIGNKAIQLAGSIGLNFVGGFSEGLQDTQVQGGVAFRPSSLKNALLNGAAHTAIDESREMMSSLKSSQPVMRVDAGKEIVISFQ